jgi:hypothetical protein
MNTAMINNEITDTMYELALKVRSKADFERFVDRLSNDYDLNGAVWENHSVPEFLAALAECSRRSPFAAELPPVGVQQSVEWQGMARLLLGATVLR